VGPRKKKQRQGARIFESGAAAANGASERGDGFVRLMTRL